MAADLMEWRVRTKARPIYITQIRTDPPESLDPRSVTQVRWIGPPASATNQSSVQQVVDWLNEGGDVIAGAPGSDSRVEVKPAHRPYISADNLSGLPRF